MRKLKILIPLFALVILVILCALGFILFLPKTRSTEEVIFVPTEVGTPEGPKVTKNIGPEGGTLSSPDGRMTLTVPPNALTETIPFSIQPITNKAAGGIGLAYRLEPDGKTFATPLQVSVHYDDKDLEGTVPEALSIAYQDKKGAWHAQRSAKLDQEAKTLTISTTHFTDFATFPRLRINPPQTTLYVGESRTIGLTNCPEPGFLDKLLSRPVACDSIPKGKREWSLRGPGAIEVQSDGASVNYTAPAKKPTPNTATVYIEMEMFAWNTKTGEATKVSKTFATKITIIDRGYKATGQSRDSVISGVVCDLEKPFSLNAKDPLGSFDFNFVPANSTSGTVSWSVNYHIASESGSGTYTVAGDSGAGYKIEMKIGATATVMGYSKSVQGTGSINLTPLETNECR